MRSEYFLFFVVALIAAALAGWFVIPAIFFLIRLVLDFLLMGAYSMFAGLVVLTGLWFWGPLFVLSILTLYALESKSSAFCTIILLATVIFFQLATEYQPLTYAYHNPLNAALLVVGYFLVGTIYLVPKWWSYVNQIREKFEPIKASFIAAARHRKGLIAPDDGYIDSSGALTSDGLRACHQHAMGRLGMAIPPRVSHHKSMLYMWFIAWPLSMIWTVIDDPLRRIWNFIYSRVGSLLQNISDNAFNR